MKDSIIKNEIIQSKNQLNLFGYENYFNLFIKLFKNARSSKTILLNGPKGLGKSTFIYHFINYILSNNEEHKYSLKNFEINSKNNSYNLISKKIHPNFFLLENNLLDENIKIDQVRVLLKFLSKTTYSNNMKFIMIDNAEYLNLNSSNALLKALEESNDNTYFFIIHDSSKKILDTIKSRCLEFKIFFNNSQKKYILENIIKQYNIDFGTMKVDENFYFDSPGNLLRYISAFNELNLDPSKEKLKCIFSLIERFKSKKDSEHLRLATLIIEKYYNELLQNTDKKSSHLFLNRYKVLNQISDMKKFNLDKKNLVTILNETLINEKR